MPQDIAQFYGGSWAPATFVTINGTPMRKHPREELRFDPSICRYDKQDPYESQLVFRPDFPYFKRWQCRANAYLNRWQAQHPNVPGFQGQSPY